MTQSQRITQLEREVDRLQADKRALEAQRAHAAEAAALLLIFAERVGQALAADAPGLHTALAGHLAQTANAVLPHVNPAQAEICRELVRLAGQAPLTRARPADHGGVGPRLRPWQARRGGRKPGGW